jgi:AraC family transcriptional regulator, regulatory protein of adaptative response / DNA-3-methyladenine glycosylase II
VGVTTTGIYCRAGCRSPRDEHRVTFPSAAAAEAAGYRACLRCRPYRTSTVDVDGVPEVVCRSVRLILDGVLDDGKVARLASTVGVSGRHLRRLFEEHLGVSPIQLAVSIRAHFARRLLDDTDMSLTEIAYSTGFGSVRQFNRVMLDVFRMTPQELRRRRRRTDRLVADGGLLLRLPTLHEVDIPGAFRLLTRAAAPGVESVTDAGYRRIALVEGDVAVIELLSHVATTHVLVKLHLPSSRDLLHVVHKVRHVLGLDMNPIPAIRHLQADPLMRRIARNHPNLRPVAEWNSYEAAVKAIVGVPVDPDATSRLGQLVQYAGAQVSGLAEMGLTHAFPAPGDLAHIDRRGIALPSRMIDALVCLSESVVEGSLKIGVDEPLDVQVGSLLSVEGVDHATAERFALMTGSCEMLPAQRGIVCLLEQATRESFSPRDFHALCEQWYPFGSFAFAHLAALG